MANILIATALFPPEPVVSANLSLDVATELFNLGHKVTVIAPPPTRPLGFKFDKTITNYPFPVIRTNSYTCAKSSIIGRFRESYSFGMAIKKHLLANPGQYEKIYANTWPLVSQFILVNTAKRLNIPVITHIQDIYPESLGNKIPFLGLFVNKLLLPLDRYILKNSYKLVVISEIMQDYLIRSRVIEKKKISVVFNWQSDQEFVEFHQSRAALSQFKNELFTFMYLGNIGPVAGVDQVIEGFRLAKLNNTRLIIAGSGSMRGELEEKVKHQKMNNVFFIDVPNGQVPETQHLADVLILPMKKGTGHSSIPSKLTAYMLSKKPVIGCVDKNSETARCILEAKCGQVIEPENAFMLSQTLQEFASKPKEELELMGQNGYNFALKHLSKTANLGKLINVILS